MINSIIIDEQYKKDNYKSVITNGNKENCIIFCSSNRLINGNKDYLTSFYNQIVVSDRYEWQNISSDKKIRKKYGTIIFLRDIYEKFYVDGINEGCNSIDKIVLLIEELTKGKKVTIVGFSAGGYLASILGVKLKAQRVFSFGGVINLYKWGGANDDYQYKDIDVLVKNETKHEKSKYYDISKLIKKSNIPIYYYYSAKCIPDIRQFKEIENCKNVRCLSFDSEKHGVLVYPVNYIDLFVLENDKLDKIFNEFTGDDFINKNKYSIKVSGLLKTTKSFIKEEIKKYIKKRKAN